jgi:dihydroceramide fatty acyl 2-hydroxylase
MTKNNPFLLGAFEYMFDLGFMPFVVMGMIWLASFYLGGWAIAGYMGEGFILWTLAEYFIHRVIFHHFPYFEEQHDVHHRQPKAWVGANTLITLSGFILVMLLMIPLVPWGVHYAITSGFIVGYLTYSIVHIQFHHGAITPLFKSYFNYMTEYHNGHHRGGSSNFGVTSPVWDMVFRTFRR